MLKGGQSEANFKFGDDKPPNLGNTYKTEDNGSVKLFQVRQQDHKWYMRIVVRKKGKRVGVQTTQGIDAVEGEAHLMPTKMVLEAGGEQ